MNIAEIFDFQFPIKFCCGKIALETLPAELRVYGSKKPLILFSVDAMIKGLIDPVTNVFNESDMVIGIYDSVPEIPSLKIIRELTNIFKKNGHDSIIAVGSGSVMHTAKVLNIAVSENDAGLKDFTGRNKIKKVLHPFFVVPTASGTGLMANGFAEVEDMAFTSHYLIPNYAVLDSKIVQKETIEIVADGALRALAISSEAYTLPESNCFIDPYAYLSIQTIKDNLIQTIDNVDTDRKIVDYLILSDVEKGRMALTSASIISGFISYYYSNNMVYKLGEALSSVCGIPSGICMGLLLPYGLEYNKKNKGYRTDELLLALEGSDIYSRTPETKRSMVAMDIIRDIMNQLFDRTSGAIPRTLANLELTDEKCLEIAALASGEDEGIKKEDYLLILKHATSGMPVVFD